MEVVIKRALVVATLALALAASGASAQMGAHSPFASGLAGYTPSVPISAFARAASWFDPSRLHVSTMLSVGSGFGGGTSGLQVTSLSYQFAAPLAMRVSVGNRLGGPSFGNSNNANFFLEGLDLAYHPYSSLTFQIHYQDVRSPLQYRGFGYSSDPWH